MACQIGLVAAARAANWKTQDNKRMHRSRGPVMLNYMFKGTNKMQLSFLRVIITVYTLCLVAACGSNKNKPLGSNLHSTLKQWDATQACVIPPLPRGLSPALIGQFCWHFPPEPVLSENITPFLLTPMAPIC